MTTLRIHNYSTDAGLEYLYATDDSDFNPEDQQKPGYDYMGYCEVEVQNNKEELIPTERIIIKECH